MAKLPPVAKHVDAKAGSLVLYKAHEDWGVGLVRQITPGGMLQVDFEINGEFFTDSFHPNELRPSGPGANQGLGVPPAALRSADRGALVLAAKFSLPRKAAELAHAALLSEGNGHVSHVAVRVAHEERICHALALQGRTDSPRARGTTRPDTAGREAVDGLLHDDRAAAHDGVDD